MTDLAILVGVLSAGVLLTGVLVWGLRRLLDALAPCDVLQEFK